MIVEHRWRRERALYWATLNPIPAEGEPILETDTGNFKIGDGSTHWNDLPYFVPSQEVDNTSLEAHINSSSPHPEYDGVDLLVLYNNAKV